MDRRRLVVGLVLSTVVAAAVSPVYYPLSLFPYPTTVKLPAATGPVPVRGPTSSISNSCDARVHALFGRLFEVRAAYSPVPKTFPVASYEQSAAWCPPSAARCSQDPQCSVGLQCWAPPSDRWNSTAACSPAAPGCGCCLSQNIPPLQHISVSCTAATDTAEARGAEARGAEARGAEAYQLAVNGQKIELEASTSVGAARGLATLSQMLRWDVQLQEYWIDRVPVTI